MKRVALGMADDSLRVLGSRMLQGSNGGHPSSPTAASIGTYNSSMPKWLFALALIGLLQACTTQDSAPTISTPDAGPRNPWQAFLPGSWVEVGVFKIGHEEEGPMGVFRDEVVGAGNGDEPEIRSSWKSSPSKAFQSSSQPFFYLFHQGLTEGLLERSRRRETIKLAGRELDCTVVTYADEHPGPRQTSTLTLWKSDTVALHPISLVAPSGGRYLTPEVVKATAESRRGGWRVDFAMELEDLDATIEVGGRKVHSNVVRYSSTAQSVDDEGASPVLRSWRIWLSPEIPGGIARRERQCTAAPHARLHEYTIRDEVTAFAAVR